MPTDHFLPIHVEDPQSRKNVYERTYQGVQRKSMVRQLSLSVRGLYGGGEKLGGQYLSCGNSSMERALPKTFYSFILRILYYTF